MLSRLTLLLSLLVASGFLAVPAAAVEGDRFTCRASVARVEGLPLGLPDIEPFVANEGGDPCVTDTGGLLPGPVTVNQAGVALSLNALFAQTTQSSSAGTAEAGVVELTVSVAGHTVSAEVLVAEASASCPGPTLSGSSTVVGVTIDGTEIEVPEGHLDVPIAGVATLHLNHQDASSDTITQRALWLETGTVAGINPPDVIVAEAIADFHGNPCKDVTQSPSPGWMTGGGKIQQAALTHGFRLNCSASDTPNRLQANWDSGNRFHLEVMVSARCSDTEGIDAGDPPAGFDTHEGTGVGRCNGIPAVAEWRLTDAGEPGKADTIALKVSGGCSVDASGTLKVGNHQAHSS